MIFVKIIKRCFTAWHFLYL